MEKRTNIVKIFVHNTQLNGPNARMDKFLSNDDNLQQVGVTRSGLTKLFEQNRITIDGIPAKKSQKVRRIASDVLLFACCSISIYLSCLFAIFCVVVAIS
jgi:hypothetical protein